MIVAQVLNRYREDAGLSQADFLDRARLTQSTWSRINRGLSHLSLEELRVACSALGVTQKEVIEKSEDASQRLQNEEGIGILDTLKGSENKLLLPTIIAGAALAFLIARLVQR